jgi:hypothetical protein
VAVWITDVRSDFAPVVLRFREELGTLGCPLLVDLRDVGHAYVQERARAIGNGRRLERDGGLVVRGPATLVEDQPAVGDLHDHRITLEQDLRVEQGAIELAGAILVGYH